MTDFNPYSRVRKEEDFLSPPGNIITRLKALLATPIKIKGIDVSHWNGAIDWKAVRESGIDFAIIKATEGVSFLDPQWQRNWRVALDYDIIPMPYHFFRDQYKGAPQVNWFMQNIDTYLEAVEGKTIGWADVETDNGSGVTARQNRLYGFCSGIEGKGLRAGYYSSKSKWEKLIGNPAWANDFLQWVASWSRYANMNLPAGWTLEQCKFRQFGIYPTYDWTFPVKGAGTVDVNWFYGSVQELRDLIGYPGTPPPPPADCCEEVRADIRFIKGELGTLNQRAELHETDIVQLNQDFDNIHRIENEIRKIFG